MHYFEPFHLNMYLTIPNHLNMNNLWILRYVIAVVFVYLLGNFRQKLFTSRSRWNSCRKRICNRNIISISWSVNSIEIEFYWGGSTNYWNTTILYFKNTYGTSNAEKSNVFVHEKITIPVYHLHMKKLIHHLDIALYSQLNSRLVFLHLLLLTISVKNILSILKTCLILLK